MQPVGPVENFLSVYEIAWQSGALLRVLRCVRTGRDTSSAAGVRGGLCLPQRAAIERQHPGYAAVYGMGPRSRLPSGDQLTPPARCEGWLS